MADHSDEIIKKYRAVAHLPDFLFAFTFPLRKEAVQKLALRPGDRVLDIGCGTGANFAYLVQAVGPAGQVVGVDLSPDMVAGARERVRLNRWANVEVIGAAAEQLSLPGEYDGLLLFAMHDVLTSTGALRNILALLKPGGRVVTAGPKLAEKGPGQVLNLVVRATYGRFAVSSQDLDRPWRLLASQVPHLTAEERGLGLIYLAWGEGGAG